MKFCTNCGQQCNDEMSFCSKCGNALINEPQEYFCPTCGKSLGEKFDSFCPYCGQSFGDTASNSGKEQLFSTANNINHQEDQIESDINSKNNNKGYLKAMLIIFAVILFFGIGFGLLLSANKASSNSNNVQKNSNASVPMMVKARVTKSIPKDFVQINVLNQVMHVPKEFEKMEIPKHLSNAGMALTGNVWKKGDASKNIKPDFYNITVLFEKADDLRKIKPEEEEQVLEQIFKNSWNAMLQTAKVATKRELVSKEICKNIDGHKYLKAVSTIGVPNKPNRDRLENIAIYVFDDTMYFITIDESVRSNNKYTAEINIILDTFGAKK